MTGKSGPAAFTTIHNMRTFLSPLTQCDPRALAVAEPAYELDDSGDLIVPPADEEDEGKNKNKNKNNEEAVVNAETKPEPSPKKVFRRQRKST